MKPFRQFFQEPFIQPAIVAHRGAWHDAPENSLKAIRLAADEGYEIAEIDVQKSADGVFFLMHDDSLSRMVGHDAIAEHLTWAELSQMSLHNYDGTGDVTGHKIPTLQDALAQAQDRIYLDIDVKHVQHMSGVADLIAKEGMADYVDIKIDVQTQADAAELVHLQDLYGVMVMPKTRFLAETVDAQIAILADIGAVVVETKFNTLETIISRKDAFTQAGLNIWVNTLDPVACCDLTDTRALETPEDVWGRLMNAGVSVFQTDEPEALSTYRTQRQAA